MQLGVTDLEMKKSSFGLTVGFIYLPFVPFLFLFLFCVVVLCCNVSCCFVCFISVFSLCVCFVLFVYFLLFFCLSLQSCVRIFSL